MLGHCYPLLHQMSVQMHAVSGMQLQACASCRVLSDAHQQHFGNLASWRAWPFLQAAVGHALATG